MKNQAQRKITLTLPDSLVKEAQAAALSERKTRSEFFALAIQHYLSEKKRIEQKEKMKIGYLEMAEINLEMATQAFASDESALKVYEDFLSESEESDCKTR